MASDTALDTAVAAATERARLTRELDVLRNALKDANGQLREHSERLLTIERHPPPSFSRQQQQPSSQPSSQHGPMGIVVPPLFEQGQGEASPGFASAARLTSEPWRGLGSLNEMGTTGLGSERGGSEAGDIRSLMPPPVDVGGSHGPNVQRFSSVESTSSSQAGRDGRISRDGLRGASPLRRSSVDVRSSPAPSMSGGGQNKERLDLKKLTEDIEKGGGDFTKVVGDLPQGGE